VCDRLRVKLQYDRVSNLPSGGDRVLLAGCDTRLNGWNAIGRKKLFRFRFSQNLPSRIAHAVDDLLRGIAVRPLTGPFGKARRLVERPQITAVLPHVVERPDGSIRIGECGNVRCIQDRFTSQNVGATHPTRQNRLSQIGVRLQKLGRARRVRHRLRRQNDEQSIAVRIL
jgi:hypothetical protein